MAFIYGSKGGPLGGWGGRRGLRFSLGRNAFLHGRHRDDLLPMPSDDLW